MKNKNKKLRLARALVMFASVFIFSFFCQAESPLKINKVQFGGGAGKPDEDFIELLNSSEEAVDLKGYRLVKRAKTATHDTTIKSWTENTPIPAHGTYVWANSKNGFAESIHADISTSQTISNGNGIALRKGKEDDGALIDSLNWKEAEAPKEENLSHSGKLRINEIYPNPDTKAGEKEFIEIRNVSEEKINLKGLIITDSSHNGKSIDASIFLEPDGLYAQEGTFYLNSPGDTARLLDDSSSIIDSVVYDKARSGYSYSFDGSSWRWTTKVTPGKENEFDKVLSGKVKTDKHIYTNVYSNFEIKTDKDTKRITWDFGDGHKSYLKKTRHKYEESGDYSASVKLAGHGEDKIYDFRVEVEDYEAPKVRIIGLSPNPKGRDTESEWILVQNNSKKKIDLLGWSIATGWKNLYNHPIRKSFVLKAGKSKNLTRKFCAFSLNNTQTKIELRTPDGETVQKIKYDRKKDKIEEDETYGLNGKNWQWNRPETVTKEPLESSFSPAKETNQESEETSPVPELHIVPESEIQANIGKHTPNISWQKRGDGRAQLISYGVNINTPTFLGKNQGRVLGVATERKSAQENHWALAMGNGLWKKVNLFINMLLVKL